jgi:hypothetical protein
MIEGIIEIFIHSYFNCNSPNFNSIGEVLGIVQSNFSLALIVVIMPLINIYLLIQAYKDINNLDHELIK